MNIKKIIILSIIIVIGLFISLKISLLLLSQTNTFGIHYSLLASSFLDGKIDINFTDNISKNDFVFLKNNVYIAFAPFPAILLTPLVKIFPQELLLAQAILTLSASFCSFILIYKILKHYQISQTQIKWILIWFFFGSYYLFYFQRITTWGLQHTVAMTFVLAAILASLEKRQYFFVGSLISAAFLTRYTTIFYLPVIYYLTAVNHSGWKVKNLAQYLWFCLPLGITMIVFFVHNYLRFGSLMEVGHSLNTSTVIVLSRDAPFGLVNYHYILKNLFGMFFYLPLPLMITNLIYQSKDWQFFFGFIEPTPSILLSALLPVVILIKSNLKKYLPIIITISLFFISTLLWFRLDTLYLADALPAILILLIIALKYKKISEALFFNLILYSIIFNFYWNLIQLNHFL